MAENKVYCADCLPALREMPDNAFDLAVVDPPYGGGAKESAADAFANGAAGRFGGNFRQYIQVERRGCGWNKYGNAITNWDVRPPDEYFDELFRVSKNQIIFGGNYFALPPTRCFIVWRKINIPLEGFSMSPVEYAWASFNDNAAVIECSSMGGGRKKTRASIRRRNRSRYTAGYSGSMQKRDTASSIRTSARGRHVSQHMTPVSIS